MKARLYTLILCALMAFPLCAFGRGENSSRAREVVVYTYDSFISEWGAGPRIAELFEKKTGYRCVFIDTGDGAQVLSRAILEKNTPRADIILGVDNNLLAKALEADILEAYSPAGLRENVEERLIFDKSLRLIPYDWSSFSIMFDTASGLTPPASLEDLTADLYRKKIILMDPRTSTPGLGFVAWTIAVYRENYLDYWRRLKPNVLTVAPGWSTGYGLFTSGEAPLTISYTTSAAYHEANAEGERFRALTFDQGQTYQIEGAGILKGAANAEGARAFMDFLLSEEAQSLIPETQWMYPVNKQVRLPPSYAAAPFSPKDLSVDSAELERAAELVMQLFAE